MESAKANFKDVDAYMATFPLPIQKLLTKLRKTIISVVPDATEVICYQMPAYKYKGMLVYFAAYKNHINFYPNRALSYILRMN